MIADPILLSLSARDGARGIPAPIADQRIFLADLMDRGVWSIAAWDRQGDPTRRFVFDPSRPAPELP